MPTLAQLNIVLESQSEFFGGSGLPKQNFEGSADGYGLTDEKFLESPQSTQNSFFKFEGEHIGEISINPATKELVIKVNP